MTTPGLDQRAFDAAYAELGPGHLDRSQTARRILAELQPDRALPGEATLVGLALPGGSGRALRQEWAAWHGLADPDEFPAELSHAILAAARVLVGES